MNEGQNAYKALGLLSALSEGFKVESNHIGLHN